MLAAGSEEKQIFLTNAEIFSPLHQPDFNLGAANLQAGRRSPLPRRRPLLAKAHA
jgi:hypothetical protein